MYNITNFFFAHAIDYREKMPLTFKSIGNTTICLSSFGSPDSIILLYSKNNGAWTNYNINSNIDLTNGDTVAFSGNNDHFSKYVNPEGDTNNSFYQFIMSGDGNIQADGNVMSLTNFDNLIKHAYQFARLFFNCKNLTIPPILPAINTSSYCYRYMFRYSSISNVPILKASTDYVLGGGCFEYMFADCMNITTVPKNYLPYKKLNGYCYMGMFRYCKNLLEAPNLPATTITPNGCYLWMFQSCSKLSSIEVNFTEWGTENQTDIWLDNCASTGTFICPAALPHTSLYFDSSHIPPGWTVITK